jgi:sugar/nucleoside kinase (ribokinase family)
VKISALPFVIPPMQASSIPSDSLQRLDHTKAMWTNGFVFDELPLDIVVAACRQAIGSGAAVFFDPGPRCFTMLDGGRRAALDAVLDLSDVVLMTEVRTHPGAGRRGARSRSYERFAHAPPARGPLPPLQEEARIVTGHKDPEAAARYVLDRPSARAEWAVVKLGKDGALLRSRSEQRTYVFKGIEVEVQDTVGCGDSFASAIVLGFTRKHSIPATLALANAVGAATAMGRGAGRNVANASRVMQLLQQEEQKLGRKEKAAVKEALHILRDSLAMAAPRVA